MESPHKQAVLPHKSSLLTHAKYYSLLCRGCVFTHQMYSNSEQTGLLFLKNRNYRKPACFI